jgi:hypothetical protein
MMLRHSAVKRLLAGFEVITTRIAMKHFALLDLWSCPELQTETLVSFGLLRPSFLCHHNVRIFTAA